MQVPQNWSDSYPRVSSVLCRAFRIPTDAPEADGTLEWSATTVVIVEVGASGETGLGWTYASDAAQTVVEGELKHSITGIEVFDIPRAHEAMVRACRNLGRSGVVACAVSATDVALWDLKAKLLGMPLAGLFGRFRESVPVYGSGGFTTYDDATTRREVEEWVGPLGIDRVKIKIGESWGSKPDRDLARVALVRAVAGDDVELYVDANGAYSRKMAVRMGRRMADDFGVTWFEEPVSSDDLVGLRQVRDLVPPDVAAGEYGYDQPYFARMLHAGAVDCLQIDVTRCGGYTGWLRAAALAAAEGLDVSAHCCPALHLPVAQATPNLRHVEYFHDHARLEPILFDGTAMPAEGLLHVEVDRVGHGYVLKERDAAALRTA